VKIGTIQHPVGHTSAAALAAWAERRELVKNIRQMGYGKKRSRRAIEQAISTRVRELRTLIGGAS
jgi:hypothetical protein